MSTTTLQLPDQFADLLDALACAGYRYGFKLKDLPAGQALLSASPQEQRGFVLAAVERLRSPNILPPRRSPWDFVLAAVEYLGGPVTYPPCRSPWHVVETLAMLLRRRLPFTHDEVIALLDWATHDTNFWHIDTHLVKVVEDYLKAHERTPALQSALEQYVKTFESRAFSADLRRRLAQLKGIAGCTPAALPLQLGDVWADVAFAEITGLSSTPRLAWGRLLDMCLQVSGAAPSRKWLAATRPLLEQIGLDDFKAALLRWFPLVDKPGAELVEHYDRQYPRLPLQLFERNADTLKGLVWLCAEREDRQIARALAGLAISSYRKLPAIGPRCVRVGNACIWALGQMPGAAGIEQLARLKAKIRFGTAQRVIETALAAAAARAGLARDAIEELLVPSYGLQEVGLWREPLGDITAELIVTGTHAVELRWIKADGKRLAAVPRAVREQHAELLKELAQTTADIKKMLPVQRDRIEQLYLQRATWPLVAWRERYLDHPLVGTLARRLIWTFRSGERGSAGIWHVGQIVGFDNLPLDWVDESTQVELWHPLHDTTEAVLAWRDWLVEHTIQQPFKQAHREIYLLTDAERATRVYSNRFAAHLLRQHQCNALCGARGWKNQLRLMVDDVYPPAMRLLPAWGLRAEFWIEGAGDDYRTDINTSGTYNYVTTDQVRFYSLDAPENYAHAGGGGYQGHWHHDRAAAEPIELEQVPALVFSEIMRDVDLFVGVASVGNDPAWSDGGTAGQYRTYWARYAFGDLSEMAKMRQQVLARLIPRLSIADRCRLTERFLIVRGDLRTYKIHLGSSNILMEPNDQYLCIVPARGGALAGGDGKLFLPFEGDPTLAIILSKALLLAKDSSIQDQTILRQIRR